MTRYLSRTSAPDATDVPHRTHAPRRFLPACAVGLAFALLHVSYAAEARLIRDGGRARVSNNSATFVFLAENSMLDGDNLVYPEGGSRPDQDSDANPATMESGSERIYTVPSDCFTLVGSVEAEEEFNARNEDCRYEFFEGDTLEFFGFMDHFLPASESIEVFWTLTSRETGFEFEFPGGLTSFDADNDFSSTTAALNLTAPPPPGLTIGEYEIVARTLQTAPEGFSFFTYAFVELPQCGVELNGPDEPTVCLQFGQNFGSSYENVSLPTRVTILGAPVPAPSTLSLFLVAALAGLWRRFGTKQRAGLGFFRRQSFRQ